MLTNLNTSQKNENLKFPFLKIQDIKIKIQLFKSHQVFMFSNFFYFIIVQKKLIIFTN